MEKHKNGLIDHAPALSKGGKTQSDFVDVLLKHTQTYSKDKYGEPIDEMSFFVVGDGKQAKRITAETVSGKHIDIPVIDLYEVFDKGGLTPTQYKSLEQKYDELQSLYHDSVAQCDVVDKLDDEIDDLEIKLRQYEKENYADGGKIAIKMTINKDEAEHLLAKLQSENPTNSYSIDTYKGSYVVTANYKDGGQTQEFIVDIENDNHYKKVGKAKYGISKDKKGKEYVTLFFDNGSVNTYSMHEVQKKYDDGGWIQDATSKMKKKGTVGSFTKMAKRHGDTPVEYAKEVLDHPSKHTLKTRRKAQFVKNTNPEKFDEGGLVSGMEIEFRHGRDDSVKRGQILDVLGDGEYAVMSGFSQMLVKENEILGVAPEQNKRWYQYEDGGEIKASDLEEWDIKSDNGEDIVVIDNKGLDYVYQGSTHQKDAVAVTDTYKRLKGKHPETTYRDIPLSEIKEIKIETYSKGGSMAGGGQPHDLSTQEGRDTYVKASSKPNKYMAKRKYDEMGNFLGYYAEGGGVKKYVRGSRTNNPQNIDKPYYAIIHPKREQDFLNAIKGNKELAELWYADTRPTMMGSREYPLTESQYKAIVSKGNRHIKEQVDFLQTYAEGGEALSDPISTKEIEDNKNREIELLIETNGKSRSLYSAKELKTLSSYDYKDKAPVEIVQKMWGLAIKECQLDWNNPILAFNVGTGDLFKFVDPLDINSIIAYESCPTKRMISNILYAKNRIVIGENIGVLSNKQITSNFQLAIGFCSSGETLYSNTLHNSIVRNGYMVAVVSTSIFESSEPKYDKIRQILNTHYDLVVAYKIPSDVMNGKSLIALRKL